MAKGDEGWVAVDDEVAPDESQQGVKPDFDADARNVRQHLERQTNEDPMARFNDLDVLDVEPIFDRVVIRIATSADKLGGVFLPAARDDKPQEGVVCSVGELCKRVKPGDRVIFGRFSGTDVQLGPVRSNKPTVLICCEDDVLAILHPGKTNELPFDPGNEGEPPCR